MYAYKGFEPDLSCRGYRFVMGKNVTPEANCASNGFHCAENPLDCLTYYSDMDEWLKSHIAFILPCAYACYAVDGELSRTTVEQRRMIVDAAWECCEMLKAAGVPVNDAENTDRYREGTKQRKKTERMVYWMAQTVVGKWCISDHAMRAVSEMQYLDEAFAALRATTLVEMTAWDELRRSLPRKK